MNSSNEWNGAIYHKLPELLLFSCVIIELERRCWYERDTWYAIWCPNHKMELEKIINSGAYGNALASAEDIVM